MRTYLIAVTLLLASPLGIAAGVAVAVSAGWGVAVGSTAYGLIAVFALVADIHPDTRPREVDR